MKIGWVDSHGFKSIGEREKKGREKTACENMEYNVKYEHKFQTKRGAAGAWDDGARIEKCIYVERCYRG
jgi:hypothetical protein